MGSTVTCPTSTCTLVIVPYVATQDDYNAISTIFALIFGAACLIWGAKQIYLMFRSQNES
jgi:hypothetical protein